jgi:predicted small lipoprotein YifL
MKKLLMLVIGLGFVFTLAACGDNGEIDLPKELEDLTPQEIADKLVEDFDGDLTHLEEAMATMDMSEAYEMTMEAEVQMSVEGNTVGGFVSVTDRMIVTDGFTTFSRTQTMEVDGMTMSVEMIMEEVSDGMNIYFNVGGLLDSLPMDIKGEVEDALAAFNLTEDWLFFHFEDSIENVVEIEAMKDFLLFILEDELGANAYAELQDELEFELGFDLIQYGVDFEEIGALLEANDYDGLQAVLEAIDVEGIQGELEYEIDQPIPGLDPIEFEAALMALDQEAFHAELKTFDFQVMLQKVALGEDGFNTWVNTLGTDYPQMKSLLVELVPMVAFLEDEDALNEVGYIANNIDTFDKYFDLQTYIEDEIVEIDVEVVNTTDVLTTMLVNPENFAGVFQELVTDIYWFAYQFPGSDVGYVEYLNCPSGQQCDDFDIFVDIEDELMGVDPLEFEFLFEPGAESAMTISIDAADFMESMGAKQGQAVIAQEFGMTMTMKEGAVINIPTNVANVKDALTEVLKVQMVQDLRWEMEDIIWQAEWNELPVDTATSVSELEWYLFGSAALDREASTFTLHANSDVSVNLVWRDGGNVFSEPVFLSDLEQLNDDFNNNGITRAEVEAYLDYIEEANFNLGKALLYFMMN